MDCRSHETCRQHRKDNGYVAQPARTLEGQTNKGVLAEPFQSYLNTFSQPRSASLRQAVGAPPKQRCDTSARFASV